MDQKSPVKYQYLLFDLDGTLSNPKEGITRSVQYALRDQGIIENDLDKLTIFIGPPLEESFMNYYGMSKEEAAQATQKYRERFIPIGAYENMIFEDTKEVLQTLQKHGYHLCIATSKPEAIALKIIDHFEITSYFDLIKGASETRKQKEEVIEDALALLNHPDPSVCLMIGDRKHDIIGAKKNHIDSAGLRCGFALEGELESHGATYIFDSLTKLKEFLI